MVNPAKAPSPEQAEQLARWFAADVLAQQRATAELVQALAGVQMPAQVGQHARRSLEALAADSGFSSAGPAELAPVLSIGGRVYR